MKQRETFWQWGRSTLSDIFSGWYSGATESSVRVGNELDHDFQVQENEQVYNLTGPHWSNVENYHSDPFDNTSGNFGDPTPMASRSSLQVLMDDD